MSRATSPAAVQGAHADSAAARVRLQGVPTQEVAYIDRHPHFQHLSLYERLIEVSRFDMR